MLNLEAEHTFQRWLSHGNDAAAADVFAEQHAEIRRSQRTGFAVLRQVDKRQACGSREQQPEIPFLGFDRQEKLVCFRLRNLGNAAAGKIFI